MIGVHVFYKKFHDYDIADPYFIAFLRFSWWMIGFSGIVKTCHWVMKLKATKEDMLYSKWLFFVHFKAAVFIGFFTPCVEVFPLPEKR